MEKIGEVKKAYAAIGTGALEMLPMLRDLWADLAGWRTRAEKLRRKYDRYLDGSSPSSSSSEEGDNHR